MGTMIMGKSEAGLVSVGDVLQVMPNKMRVKVEAVYRDEQESFAAKVGCGALACVRRGGRSSHATLSAC
jgi:translation elongation factor EF-1alpha